MIIFKKNNFIKATPNPGFIQAIPKPGFIQAIPNPGFIQATKYDNSTKPFEVIFNVI